MPNWDSSTYDLIATALDALDTFLFDDVSQAADEDRIQRLTKAELLAGLLGAFGGSNTETLSADKTLVDGDAFLQFLDPGGADRDVEAPAEDSKNHPFMIVNTADADEDLVFKNDAGDTIVTVGQDEAKLVVSDGTDWRALSGGSGGGSTDELQTALISQVFG